MDNSAIIPALNDGFRSTLIGGRVMLSAAVAALPSDVRAMAIRRMVAFKDFSADNDPHGEHDFGAFDLAGYTFFWKIDYCDPDLVNGSEDPANPDRTMRVLTLMLAEDY